MVQHIRQKLAPDNLLAAAPDEGDGNRRDRQTLHPLPQGKSNSLQAGPGQVGGGGLPCQSKKAPPCLRVQNGEPLSGEIGQAQDAMTAGNAVLQQGVHRLIIRRAALSPQHTGDPLVDVPGVQERHHVDVAALLRRSQIEYSCLHQQDIVRHGGHPAGGAQIDVVLSRLADTAGKRRGARVADAGEYRRSGPIAAGGRCLRENGAHLLVGMIQRGKQPRLHPGSGQEPFVPALTADVHGPCRGAGGHVPSADAGEPGDQIILGADQDMGRPGIQLRTVLLQPHQLGQGQRAVAAVSGGTQETVSAHSGFQHGGLGLCPAIGVKNGGTDRVQVSIQGDQILHLPAHNDTADVLCRDCFGKLPGNLAESRPPVLWGLLLKAIMAEVGQFHRAGEDGLSCFVDQGPFHGGGARVKCRDVCHGEFLLRQRLHGPPSGR